MKSLLPNLPHPSTGSNGLHPDVVESAKTEQGISLRLLVSLVTDSFPVILSYILQNSVQTVSIMVTGRLGPAELSAAAFSMMLAFVIRMVHRARRRFSP